MFYINGIEFALSKILICLLRLHIIYLHGSISHAPAHGKEESKSNPYKINISCFEFDEEAVCVSP
jgi:hypothetical protein